MNAISEGLEVGLEVPENVSNLIIKIEDSIKRRVPIGKITFLTKFFREQNKLSNIGRRTS